MGECEEWHFKWFYNELGESDVSECSRVKEVVLDSDKHK